MYHEGKASASCWSTSNFFILVSIQFLQMVRLKQLGKDALPYANKKEEW
jgi:hypothetical protein